MKCKMAADRVLKRFARQIRKEDAPKALCTQAPVNTIIEILRTEIGASAGYGASVKRATGPASAPKLRQTDLIAKI